jgi:hypothetical protein
MASLAGVPAIHELLVLAAIGPEKVARVAKLCAGRSNLKPAINSAG